HNARNLFIAQYGHALMIPAVITHVPRDVSLLQTTNAMLQTRCSWDCPRSGQGVWVAPVRCKAFQISRMRHRHGFEVFYSRDLPGLRAIPEVAIREKKDGGHKHGSQEKRLDSHIETVP